MHNWLSMRSLKNYVTVPYPSATGYLNVWIRSLVTLVVILVDGVCLSMIEYIKDINAIASSQE